MEPAYKVKTEAFEGPLDLLLELVIARKLFVNDISLSQVTDDFVAYISRTEAYPLRESAEFILVASTLLLVKSKSLLPMFELTSEEEENVRDLEQRLKTYARVKELTNLLRTIFGKRVIFEKRARKSDRIVFSPDSNTTLETLHSSLEWLMATLPKEEVLPKVVVKKVISLEEMIEKLSRRISETSKVSFRDFHGLPVQAGQPLTQEARVSIIVGFLAMLELVKRGAIRATQGGKGEIEIESESLATPSYV